MKNRLYYGDNLEILRNREYFPDECVDLIYLDPPFNSKRNYNVLFKSESGADSELIHIGQTVMAFGSVVFNCPTLVECYKTAAFDGINRLI